MSTITGFGISPFTYRSYLQAPDAVQAIAQDFDTSSAANTGGTSASQTGARAVSPTRFTAAPRLSAGVIDALLTSKAQQSTGSATGAETTLSGVSAESNQAPSSDAPPDTSSQPPTLQEIANQFDIHHLTDQQASELAGQLSSSGALSQQDGLRLFGTTALADFFDSQHYREIDGQFVATAPSPTGQLIGAGGPAGGPQYDIVQRVQQSLTADQYFGDTANAAKDQKILDVLNNLDSIRNGGGNVA
jgi:hypothetical protein